ncbi:YciI family protein [Neorhizobium tomejilense]|uniref:YciI family protein n=1 Tax=Neorhizobium tomejilense TaxID=2093828 RepID=UPI000CF975B3|nr:YciI family protein [Neorhizobium tomejilense]
MFFLMRCFHHPNKDLDRDEHRSAHRAWVQSGGEGRAVVLIGSALLDQAGNAIGNFGILQTRTLQDAKAFAEGDPFNAVGIVATIEITPLPDSFQADRISDPMTARH